jgi:membrane-bound lytic murein transglycosylase B
VLLAATGLAAQPTIAADRAPPKASRTTTRPSVEPRQTYAADPAALALAKEVAERNGWDPEWTTGWIAQAQRLPSVLRLIAPPPRGMVKNWAAYRARFIEPTRIEAGLRFWRSHRETLQRAEAVYGVPAWLVVGIIGVETLYGQHMGQFRALDALTTLALEFPPAHPRAEERLRFFRSELEALLQLSRDQGVSPTQWLGSFAGAIGLPQFMPSSWRRFAVDFDGDGRIDLRRSPADAIGSVANYMKQFGWKTGMPTHYPVGLEDVSAADLEALLAPDILPTFASEGFRSRGARLQGAAVDHAGPLALVELLNGDMAAGGSAPTYVAGTENFYVITRYNWSSYYAMAVIELGQAVRSALDP